VVSVGGGSWSRVANDRDDQSRLKYTQPSISVSRNATDGLRFSSQGAKVQWLRFRQSLGRRLRQPRWACRRVGFRVGEAASQRLWSGGRAPKSRVGESAALSRIAQLGAHVGDGEGAVQPMGDADSVEGGVHRHLCAGGHTLRKRRQSQTRTSLSKPDVPVGSANDHVHVSSELWHAPAPPSCIAVRRTLAGGRSCQVPLLCRKRR